MPCACDLPGDGGFGDRARGKLRVPGRRGGRNSGGGGHRLWRPLRCRFLAPRHRLDPRREARPQLGGGAHAPFGLGSFPRRLLPGPSDCGFGGGLRPLRLLFGPSDSGGAVVRRPAQGKARMRLVEAVADLHRPIDDLRRPAPPSAARPHQPVRNEQAPAVVALADGGGDELGSDGGGIEPVPAEGARDPHPRAQQADLRHAVDRIAHDPRPGIFDRHALELRIDARHVARHHALQSARRFGPGGDASAPHEPVADDAVIISGAAVIDDAAAIADGLRESIRDRRGDGDMGRDRQYRTRECGKDFADEGTAAEHHLIGAHAPARGRDPFAQAVEIGVDRRALLEDAAAEIFDLVGEREREIIGVDREGVGVVQRLVVAPRHERLAHPLGRPDQHIVIEMLRQQPGLALHPFRVVVAQHVEPSGHRIDAGHALGDRRAHQLDALARERIERAGVIEADPVDDAVQALGIARRNESAVAARGLAGDTAPFQHDYVVAAAGERPRRPQAGEAAADDADRGFDLGDEPRPRPMPHRGRGIVGSGGCGGYGGFACHRLHISIAMLARDQQKWVPVLRRNQACADCVYLSAARALTYSSGA